MRSKESAEWPLVNALLLDLLIKKIIAAEISLRARPRRWPHVFQSLEHIIPHSVNVRPAANQTGEDEFIRDLT